MCQTLAALLAVFRVLAKNKRTVELRRLDDSLKAAALIRSVSVRVALFRLFKHYTPTGADWLSDSFARAIREWYFNREVVREMLAAAAFLPSLDPQVCVELASVCLDGYVYEPQMVAQAVSCLQSVLREPRNLAAGVRGDKLPCLLMNAAHVYPQVDGLVQGLLSCLYFLASDYPLAVAGVLPLLREALARSASQEVRSSLDYLQQCCS